MPTVKGVDNEPLRMEAHIREKRDEIVWALFIQGYTPSQIGRLFNIRHRSTVIRIIRRKPYRWIPKWVKVKTKKR